MGYNDFLNDIESRDNTMKHFEEDVKAWKDFTPQEKAQAIQEAKESKDEKVISYVLEVAKSAKGEPIQEEEEVIKQGGSDDTAQWSDDDAGKSDKGKVPGLNDKISAVGISSGLGAMNLAKKLRRSQEQAPTPQKSEED